MTNESRTVILQTFETIAQASFVKDMLEQNGVACFIRNQYGAQLYPLFASSVGGIQLMVAEEDLAQAIDILKDINS